MHVFTDALRIRKTINCGQFAELRKIFFALSETAYLTLPYTEIIMVVSNKKTLNLACERRGSRGWQQRESISRQPAVWESSKRTKKFE